MYFSNLIIHQVEPRKITTMKEVWIPSFNLKFFDDFTWSLLTLNFLFGWVDLSDTAPQDIVSSAIQTPRILSNMFRCSSYFQLSYRCLDILVKHCSCIWYITSKLMETISLNITIHLQHRNIYRTVGFSAEWM